MSWTLDRRDLRQEWVPDCGLGDQRLAAGASPTIGDAAYGWLPHFRSTSHLGDLPPLSMIAL